MESRGAWIIVPEIILGDGLKSWLLHEYAKAPNEPGFADWVSNGVVAEFIMALIGFIGECVVSTSSSFFTKCI